MAPPLDPRTHSVSPPGVSPHGDDPLAGDPFLGAGAGRSPLDFLEDTSGPVELQIAKFWVRENPEKALLGAFVVGVLIGAFRQR